MLLCYLTTKEVADIVHVEKKISIKTPHTIFFERGQLKHKNAKKKGERL